MKQQQHNLHLGTCTSCVASRKVSPGIRSPPWFSTCTSAPSRRCSPSTTKRSAPSMAASLPTFPLFSTSGCPRASPIASLSSHDSSHTTTASLSPSTAPHPPALCPSKTPSTAARSLFPSAKLPFATGSSALRSFPSSSSTVCLPSACLKPCSCTSSLRSWPRARCLPEDVCRRAHA